MPERIQAARETLWDCAYRVELIGSVPRRIKSLKRRALEGCRVYRQALAAYDEFWRSGNYGARSNGLGLAIDADLALGGSNSTAGGGGGSSSGSGYGGGDLDCADIDGPVFVGGSDPNNFDADGDGIGCEAG